MIDASTRRCMTCKKVFGSYHAMQQHVNAAHTDREQFPFLNQYWNDPAFRAEAEAERAREQAKINASIDAAQRRAWEARGMA